MMWRWHAANYLLSEVQTYPFVELYTRPLHSHLRRYTLLGGHTLRRDPSGLGIFNSMQGTCLPYLIPMEDLRTALLPSPQGGAVFCRVIGAGAGGENCKNGHRPSPISAPTARASRCDKQYPRLCQFRSQKIFKRRGWEAQQPSDDTLHLE